MLPANLVGPKMSMQLICTFLIPIFATGIHPTEYVGVYGLRDEPETTMMDSRWRIFEFSHQMPNNYIQDIPACSKCFHDLVILDSAN